MTPAGLLGLDMPTVSDVPDAPGRYLAVDVTGVSHRADADDPRRRVPQSWAQSVEHAAALLRDTPPEQWSLTLDVGLGHEHCEPYPLPYQPGADVLSPPYLPDPGDADDSGPLRHLWARYDVIDYQQRDELDFLRSWFEAPDPPGPQTRIALLHGVGGCGKTRLAAELARQLADSGWHAGFLARATDPGDLAWLSGIASPLLVIVDYVEDRKSDDVIALLRAVHTRSEPT